MSEDVEKPVVILKFPKSSVAVAQQSSKMLVDSGILKITYQKCPRKICNKESTLLIPLSYMKKSANPFFKEELIDFGVISQPEIASVYHLELGNSHYKHAVIKRIEVQKEGFGIDIEVATFLKYMVPLPAREKPFKALILTARPKTEALSGYLSGKIRFEVDILGDLYFYEVKFRVGYMKDFLAVPNNFHFRVSKFTASGKVVFNFSGQIDGRRTGSLAVRSLKMLTQKDSNSYVSQKNSDKYVTFTDLLTRKEIARNKFAKAFDLRLEYPIEFFDRTFTHGYRLITLQALETNICFVTKFFTMKLMCGLQNIMDSSFHKCRPVEVLNFGTIAFNHSKTLAFDILNPTELDFNIKKVYSSMSESLSDVTLQIVDHQYQRNQQDLKNTKTHSNATKVVIGESVKMTLKPYQVLTVKITIRPKKIGNFEEKFAVETDLSVSYS